MTLREQVRKLAGSGRRDEAIHLVEQKVQDGNAEALFLSAAWHFGGLYGSHDYTTGHRLLAQAADKGLADAALLRANLLASGTGCAEDLAAARAILEEMAAREPRARNQLRLLKAADRPLPTAQPLSNSPEITMFKKFFSLDECDYLVRQAAPELRESVVRNAAGQSVRDPVRRSQTMQFDAAKEDLVVRSLNRRIARLTDTPIENGEALHILRYGVGDEFRPHMDAIPALANQRLLTVLVWLNDAYDGGETAFPDLDLRVKGRRGDCLVFRNAADDGTPDDCTRHAGLPVLKGVKWIASRWIHQRAYDPLEAEVSY